MLKGILFLIAFGLLPWWLSLLAERLDIPLSPSALLLSWLRADDGDGALYHPPHGWREALYFARNPDVMTAVRRGEFLSGYEHYVRYGRKEGRSDGFPAPTAAPRPSPPPSASPEPDATVAVAPSPNSPPPSLSSVAAASTSEALLEAAPSFILPSRKPAPIASTPSPVTPPPVAAPVKPTAKQEGGTGQVLAMRSAAHSGFTRIVLDSSTALRVERATLPNPRAVGIDLTAAWRPPMQGTVLGKSLTYRIELIGGITRLIIESNDGIRIKGLFALPPDSSNGQHRLVLDVGPSG